MPHQTMSQEMQDCIEKCSECASLCNQCAHHCLQMGGDHAGPDHQGLMRDCAAICGLAACFMGRSSHHSAAICRLCAEICTACAESCERLGRGDALMTQCAKLCRDCAKTCETMSAVSV